MTRIENTAAGILGTLRNAELTRGLISDEQFLPGLYFSWDSAEGDVEASLTSTPGTLFELEAKVTGKPRWWTFNIVLGNGIFAEGETLGFVADLVGKPGGWSLGAFIRSGRGEDVDDTDLADTLRIGAARQTSVVLHSIAAGEHLAGPEAYHTLIVKLPVQAGLSLTLFEMQLIRLPADASPAPQRTLADFRT